MTTDICLLEEVRESSIEKHEYAVQATSNASPRPHVQRHHHHRHDHMHEVVLPMRTRLHHYEVPYGLRLAGITTGYRQGGTHWDCILTLFTWHNQTLNSWTMIWGWMVSTWLLGWTVATLRPRGLDLLAFVALWLCPTVHLPFTVGYHQFCCISPVELRRWRALDVVFIFIASVPLTFGMAYFVLPLPYAVALTCVTIGLSLHAWHNAAALPAGADINKKANTRYVGYVVSVYSFPVMLQAAMDLWAALLGPDPRVAAAAGSAPPHDSFYTVWCAASVLFCFLFGGTTYVLSFPDVFAPGLFDIVGAAQQLMHMAISGSQAIMWLFAVHMYQRSHALA